MTDESAVTGGGATTDDNDWRVSVRLHAGGQAGQAVEHLSAHKVENEVHQRLGGRVVVGTDGSDELFLYTHTADAAATAQQSVSQVLAGHGMRADYAVERWHPVAEEWQPADVALPGTAAEVEAEREQLDAEETSESLALAERLQDEGYSVVRRWRFLVVGANNADQAAEFAAVIRQEAPAGAVISTEEVGPGRPYTVFELAAGSGL